MRRVGKHTGRKSSQKVERVMPISILCPGCKKNLKAPDHSGGKKVKCPQCGTGITVPPPSAVEEPFPPLMPARRPNKQTNHFVLFLALGLGVAGIALVVVVLAVGGFLWGSKGNQQAGVNAQPTKPADEKSDNKEPTVKTSVDDENKSVLDTKRKEEQIRLERQKAEKARLEEERKQAEEAVRNATILQAPPLEKGKYHETGDFGKMMTDLADNEFKFREAKDQVYRSTFNQRTLESTPILKRFHARNAVVTPGRYDFDAGLYFLDLLFWQALYEEKKIAEGKINPRTNDVCSLSATFKVDGKTAHRWREAIDKGTFAVTVWYRLAKVERGTWMQNPHWNPVPMLAHDIAFNVDVVKFEESSSEAVDSPKVDTKPEQPKEAPNPVAIARQTADDYVQSIEKKGLLRRAVYTGIYKNPKGEDSYAVCYTVSEVNRKPVTNQLVHVFAFKDKAGEWRISAFSSDGVHVALGPPPRGFTKVANPKATK